MLRSEQWICELRKSDSSDTNFLRLSLIYICVFLCYIYLLIMSYNVIMIEFAYERHGQWCTPPYHVELMSGYISITGCSSFCFPAESF